MTKSVIRLFWSYDILKTEKWLSQMSEKGYKLCKVNFALRKFYFESAPANNTIYRIVYDKKSKTATEQSVNSNNFNSVCENSNFTILTQENSDSDIFPSYKGILARNSKIKEVLFILLMIIIGLFIPIISILAFVFISFLSGNVTVEQSAEVIPIWTITAFIIWHLVKIGTLTWMIYSFFKLSSTNKQLEKMYSNSLDTSFTIPKNTILSKDETKRLKKNKLLFKKTRLAWFYSPDKIEKWLEKMAAEGNILVRMSKGGNSFYFIIDKPRKIRYHADYQNKTDSEYFSINEQNGWKLFFTSISRLMAWSVWGKEYIDEPDNFYTDKQHLIKKAKRIAITYSLCFIPAVIMWSFNVFTMINTCIKMNSFSFWDMILLIEFTLGLVFYIIFITKIIGYYLRTKKENT